MGKIGLEELRTYIVGWCRAFGSREPEDAAHNILVRGLANCGMNHPLVYWREAAYNETVTQYRRNRYRQQMTRSVGDLDPAPALVVGRDAATLQRLRALAVLSEPEREWLIEYSDNAAQRARNGRTRVKAHRLRAKVRRAS